MDFEKDSFEEDNELAPLEEEELGVEADEIGDTEEEEELSITEEEAEEPPVRVKTTVKDAAKSAPRVSVPPAARVAAPAGQGCGEETEEGGEKGRA